jgi:hypothetical protein
MLRVIELRKKKSFYLAVFKGVERKLLCLKIYLDTGRQSYTEIITKNISIWGINISLRLIELNREIALQKIYFSWGHKYLALGNRVA